MPFFSFLFSPDLWNYALVFHLSSTPAIHIWYPAKGFQGEAIFHLNKSLCWFNFLKSDGKWIGLLRMLPEKRWLGWDELAVWLQVLWKRADLRRCGRELQCSAPRYQEDPTVHIRERQEFEPFNHWRISKDRHSLTSLFAQTQPRRESGRFGLEWQLWKHIQRLRDCWGMIHTGAATGEPALSVGVVQKLVNRSPKALLASDYSPKSALSCVILAVGSVVMWGCVLAHMIFCSRSRRTGVKFHREICGRLAVFVMHHWWSARMLLLVNLFEQSAGVDPHKQLKLCCVLNQQYSLIRALCSSKACHPRSGSVSSVQPRWCVLLHQSCDIAACILPLISVSHACS